MFAASIAAVACTAPTALIALAFGIAKDGSPFKRSFWG